MVTDYPWLSVSGFGVHIKSTPKTLIIQKKNSIEEYPLDSIKNLLVIGGHTISSSTIVNLVKNGAYISFFEPDWHPDRNYPPVRGPERDGNAQNPAGCPTASLCDCPCTDSDKIPPLCH